ncbi:hypothetical protein Bca4012_023599 [Brassica carinata]|uniref:Uncharacterized protein n=1 Tax=Brassica carinata TaxID=52824 RepID=A0A8X7TFE8_BRACI|nr:hypothetical protein Bca52824_091541 [Brassica carinata]
MKQDAEIVDKCQVEDIPQPFCCCYLMQNSESHIMEMTSHRADAKTQWGLRLCMEFTMRLIRSEVLKLSSAHVILEKLEIFRNMGERIVQLGSTN